MTQHGPSDISVTDAPEPAGSEADRAEQARDVDDAAEEDVAVPDSERLVPVDDDGSGDDPSEE